MKQGLGVLFVFSLQLMLCLAPACNSGTAPPLNYHIQHAVDSGAYYEARTGVREEEIYAFMKVFMADRHLCPGLEIEVSPGYSNSAYADTNQIVAEAHRRKFVEDSLKQDKLLEGTEKNRNQWNQAVFISPDASCWAGPHGFLSRADYRFMCSQEQRRQSFVWDLSRLGIRPNSFYLNLPKHGDWYRFSIPLFSKDRMKVLISFEQLCSGLCGRGEEFLYEKTNDTWEGHSIAVWFH